MENHISLNITKKVKRSDSMEEVPEDEVSNAFEKEGDEATSEKNEIKESPDIESDGRGSSSQTMDELPEVTSTSETLHEVAKQLTEVIHSPSIEGGSLEAYCIEENDSLEMNKSSEPIVEQNSSPLTIVNLEKDISLSEIKLAVSHTVTETSVRSDQSKRDNNIINEIQKNENINYDQTKSENINEVQSSVQPDDNVPTSATTTVNQQLPETMANIAFTRAKDKDKTGNKKWNDFMKKIFKKKKVQNNN